MASAVLPGSNEHYCRNNNNAAASMMNYGNVPDHDPDFRRRLVPNNPTGVPIRRPPYVSHNAAPSPRTAPSQTAAPPSTSFANSDERKCITFHLSSYSRRELKEVRKFLILELDQVRSVRTRIEALPESRTQIPVPPPAPDAKKKSMSSLSLPQVSKLQTNMMRKCSQMLNKLMKHIHGWVFNKPVDAASMGLHDYHTIIRNPMDLGTIKSRMSMKAYKTPLDFAGDVRLTFNNAMLYNPKGQDVYRMAQQLLTLFDNMFNHAFQKYESDIFGMRIPKQKGVSLPKEPELRVHQLVRPVAAGVSKGKAEKTKVRKRDLTGEERLRKRGLKEEKLRKSEKLALNVEAESRSVGMNVEVESRKVRMNVGAESRNVDEAVSIKKDMSYEEKSRLAIGLQELPQPKLDEMVKIIKRRNMHLAPGNDEIEMELDIEVIDNETLWELDRLVKDNEKMVKISSNRESSPQNRLLYGVHAEEKYKKGEAGEEEVDIGDEGPINFPPLEIERDRSSSGSGSSSSSDSSSSCDSDTSGSKSEGESVQSPFVQDREEDLGMA